MAWNPQGGGPWGSGGGGGQGPWGGGGGGQQTPPDIEEMLKRSQDRFKNMMPGGFGGARGIVLLLIVAVAVWLGSGFYRVQPDQQGVELLFGKYVKSTEPGLNYWFPAPIGQSLTPNVTKTNTITIGFRGSADAGRGSVQDVPLESLMLTGDQNIIDIDFVVQWRINNAASYLFNIRDPESTIKIAAESAMREVIGQTSLEEALTIRRLQVQDETLNRLQKIMDAYGAGVTVAKVQLQKVDPPQQVIDAFNDVQRAKQDQERSVNEAAAYKNDILPKAVGQAQKMVADATAYKERLTKEAEGEAKRFLSVYETYKNAKDVTTRRLFLEKVREILKNSDKVIIDTGKSGTSVLPYLPLNELNKRQGGK